MPDNVLPLPSSDIHQLRGDRHDGPMWLEVHALWGDLILDTRHYPPGAPAVQVGGRVGWRWYLSLIHI